MPAQTIKYAAFIITYKRPDQLTVTIQKLFEQSFPPLKILIIDNDPERSGKTILKNYPANKISYYPVGYNSGPAGAAYRGIKSLFEEGWEWVLWMDDNDPPVFIDSIEKIFQIPAMYSYPEKIGMIGAVGVDFDLNTAKTIRIPDNMLKGVIEVDNIAGNMLPIVHRRVFENKILPDEKLFFGFEELDFSLAVKRSGFSILVSGEELYRYRENAGRIGFKRRLYQKRNINSLWREYYSVRNCIYILKNKERNIAGVFSLSVKSIAKSFAGFKYGFEYGKKNFGYLYSALFDGIFGRMGSRINGFNSKT